MINKSQLIDAVKEDTGYGRRDCQIIINSFIKLFISSLKTSLPVKIPNLGIFKISKKSPKFKSKNKYQYYSLDFQISRSLHSELNKK